MYVYMQYYLVLSHLKIGKVRTEKEFLKFSRQNDIFGLRITPLNKTHWKKQIHLESIHGSKKNLFSSFCQLRCVHVMGKGDGFITPKIIEEALNSSPSCTECHMTFNTLIHCCWSGNNFLFQIFSQKVICSLKLSNNYYETGVLIQLIQLCYIFQQNVHLL